MQDSRISSFRKKAQGVLQVQRYDEAALRYI